MPLLETKGAASAQGFGLTLQQTAVNYIEDVFSTYLYTGTGSSQTITNGIDLSTKGGLVWFKSRSDGWSNALCDTARGANKLLLSNGTAAQTTWTDTLDSFNSNGFSLGADSTYYVNKSASTYASWTFREQPKFFDVVTWTATGSTQTISHNLGSVPGTIIVKRTSGTSSWFVYHRSLGANAAIFLNNTNPADTGVPNYWNGTAPTSTQFTVGDYISGSGSTYVAYLFAHNAGGFGLTGTDNVISCGSFTTNSGGNATVNLGYEPQWLMVKNTSSSENWYLVDNMRGWPADHSANRAAVLYPNLSNAETNFDALAPTSTGFTAILGNTQTYIYIAIRRGPMKTPTTGTSVFSPNTWTSGTGGTITPNIAVDMQIGAWLGSGDNKYVQTRLTGLNTQAPTTSTPRLITNSTSAEVSDSTLNYAFNNTSFLGGSNYAGNGWAVNFRRAPGFFDVVCYTGTGSITTVTHNLGVAPEFIIIKSRSNGALSWNCYAAPLGNTQSIRLNSDIAAFGSYWNNTSPTATVFTVSAAQQVNENLSTYVAYLFATVAGVSKFGSYTGTGALQTINCGFTGGARFVLIKRTDSTGDWYVWDSARGIVAGNDPYLVLNTLAAQVTNTDYVDTFSSGFEISSTAPAAINANGGSFIFLAIA